jgi:hypothetical protein
MASLTVPTATSTGSNATTSAQITAWPAGDTIDLGQIGDRGVLALVSNTSGGSLDLRVSDPYTTPAGNPAANTYTTITVANGTSTLPVVITKNNVDPSTGAAKIGASTTNAAFTVRLIRY